MFFQKYTKRQNIDTKEFVYEGISPAYHYSISCNRMLSDYLNYRLPKEIKERGDKVIEEFRRWFKEHKDVLEDNPDQFLDKMQEKYNFKEKPKIKDLKKKSGLNDIINLPLNGLEKRIEILIKEGEVFTKKGFFNKLIFSTYKSSLAFEYSRKNGFRIAALGISDEEILKILNEFEIKYKEPIKTLLREYYRVKYNPNLEFQGELLSQLGFRLCSFCETKLEFE